MPGELQGWERPLQLDGLVLELELLWLVQLPQQWLWLQQLLELLELLIIELPSFRCCCLLNESELELLGDRLQLLDRRIGLLIALADQLVCFNEYNEYLHS